MEEESWDWSDLQSPISRSGSSCRGRRESRREERVLRIIRQETTLQGGEWRGAGERRHLQGRQANTPDQHLTDEEVVGDGVRLHVPGLHVVLVLVYREDGGVAVDQLAAMVVGSTQTGGLQCETLRVKP